MRARTLFVILAVGGLAAQPVSPYQQPPSTVQDSRIVRLWPGAAPGALGDQDEDTPTVTVHLPSNAMAPVAAVIVAPGGSYRALAIIKEGREPAEYLNSLGLAAF